MDVELFLQALVRRRWIVLGGVLLAFALAFLSFVRVDPAGERLLEYRDPPRWASSVTLQVTRPGFPEGRAQDGSSDRFVGLAQLYTRLANSDPVRRIMAEDGPIYGAIRTREVLTESEDPLPLIVMTAVTRSEWRSIERARRQAVAFIDYVERNQTQAGIPVAERIALQRVKGPTKAQVVQGPSLTAPVLVLLSTLIAVFALVLVLERRRAPAGAVPVTGPATLRRPTAVPPPDTLPAPAAPKARVLRGSGGARRSG